MEKIHFYNSTKIYKGNTDFINKNTIEIIFNGDMPSESEISNGFEILNDNNEIVQAEYRDYNTYQRYDDENKIRFSPKNGSNSINTNKIVAPKFARRMR